MMSIPPEEQAKILRYHHVEKWPVGTIATHLGRHHSTVTRPPSTRIRACANRPAWAESWVTMRIPTPAERALSV